MVIQETYFAYNTPIGHVTIASNGRTVTRLVFGSVDLSGSQRPTVLTNDAANQVQEYLAGKRRVFSVPVDPIGSAFQRRVWDAVLNVPYGCIRTNGQVAEVIGTPTGARSVAAACALNPVPLFVPTHRVVGANGKPDGIDRAVRIKEFLLNMEREHR